MIKNKQKIKMDAYDYHTYGVYDPIKDSPLATTNYFRSDRADKGFIHLIQKCDNYHLLLPESTESQISEVLTGKYAQVAYGTTMTIIIFEDFSINPMVLEFDNNQILGMMDAYDKPKRKGYLAIYKLGKKCADDIADEVVEVGRMDLWVNRRCYTNPYKIRSLTTEAQKSYKQ